MTRRRHARHSRTPRSQARPPPPWSPLSSSLFSSKFVLVLLICAVALPVPCGGDELSPAGFFDDISDLSLRDLHEANGAEEILPGRGRDDARLQRTQEDDGEFGMQSPLPPNDDYESLFLDDDYDVGRDRDHRHHHVRRTQQLSGTSSPNTSRRLQDDECLGFPEGISQTVYLVLYDMYAVIDTDEEVEALKRIFRDVMNSCIAEDNCLNVQRVGLQAQELQGYLANQKSAAAARNAANMGGGGNKNKRQGQAGGQGQRQQQKRQWRGLIEDDEAEGATAANRTRTAAYSNMTYADPSIIHGGDDSERWFREESARVHRRIQAQAANGAVPQRLMAKMWASGYGYCKRNPVCRSPYPLTQTSSAVPVGGGQQRRNLQQRLGTCAARMLNRLVNSRFESFACLSLVEIYGSDPRCF